MTACRNLGRNVALVSKIVKKGIEELERAGVGIPEIATFKKVREKPSPGSYLEKLVKEGKIKVVE